MEVIAALQSQNVQVSAGQFSAVPPAQGSSSIATINARTLLQTTEQFDATSCAPTRTGHGQTQGCCRNRIGTENTRSSLLQRQTAGGHGHPSCAGANALETGTGVKARWPSWKNISSRHEGRLPL